MSDDLIKYEPKPLVETYTQAMKDRGKVGGRWKDEGNGYFSLVGYSPFMGAALGYVAIPLNHPDVGKSYQDLEDEGVYPEVNGGLTFSDDNVFGWDYCHAYNSDDLVGDIQRALEFFRNRR